MGAIYLIKFEISFYEEMLQNYPFFNAPNMTRTSPPINFGSLNV